MAETDDSRDSVEQPSAPLVLIVDTNVPLRELVVGVLCTRGYRAVAVDPGDALAALDTQPDVSVVFTVPGPVHGRDLVDEVRGMRPDVSVVVVSGALEPIPVIAGVEVLPKPFGINELMEVVELATLRHAIAG